MKQKGKLDLVTYRAYAINRILRTIVMILQMFLIML
jgi:hypothetical protein